MPNPNWRPAWHQRVPLVGGVRAALRGAFYRALGAALMTDDGLSVVERAANDLGLVRLPTLTVPEYRAEVPYRDLGRAPDEPAARPVFITARFRSGSTLLWNLFRQVGTCTAYYEPLNERRWFDPAGRGANTDAAHRHVDNYWREYDGLEELGALYREEWTRRRLFMDASSWDSDLASYIR